MKIHGKPVKDATGKLFFEITLEDIKNGKPKSQTECAAALAISRAYPGCVQAAVCRSRTFIEYAKHWDRYITPPSLRNEIIVHDRDGKMEPGKYSVSPVAESQKAEIVKATWYVKKHPEMTDRTIVKKTGVDNEMVRHIRAAQTLKASVKKAKAKCSGNGNVHTLKPVPQSHLESRGRAHTPRPANKDRDAKFKQFGHRSKSVESSNRFTKNVRPVGVNF